MHRAVWKLLHLLPACPQLSAPRGSSLSHASTPRHVQGSPWEKCRTAIFTHRSFNFNKREPGFLFFMEGCKHECYPKVHQNIHSVQTCVWISKLWVLFCEKLPLSQAIYPFNCGGNRVPKIVLSARAPLKRDMSSGRLFFFQLAGRS